MKFMDFLAGMLCLFLLVQAPLSASPASDELVNSDAAEGFVPVRPELAEAFVQEFVRRWNARDLERVLASEFPHRRALLDAFPTRVPADARLRLLGLGGIQVLAQERVEAGIRSTVIANVRLQLEFEDPEHGFQRREASYEFIFRLIRRVPR